jgi:hypothetical protein
VLPGNAWSVRPDPVVDIGADQNDPAQQLDNVVKVARLSDGHIVVANVTEPPLRWFNASGKMVHSAGRAGEGPGEFPRTGEGQPGPGRVWILGGDSLLVSQTASLQVFDPVGRYVRSIAIEAVPASPRARTPGVVGLLDSGFVGSLGQGQPRSGTVGVETRDSLAFFAYTAGWLCT